MNTEQKSLSFFGENKWFATLHNIWHHIAEVIETRFGQIKFFLRFFHHTIELLKKVRDPFILKYLPRLGKQVFIKNPSSDDINEV